MCNCIVKNHSEEYCPIVLMHIKEIADTQLQILGRLGVAPPLNTEIDQSIDVTTAQNRCRELGLFTTNAILRGIPNKGFPAGNWYMVTLTQKDTETKEDILERHNKAMEYFRYSHIDVFHAALEKSNIFHIHYVCKFPNLKKNEQRDLQSITKRRVQIERKVNSLQAWNGLCKYVMKRDYNEEKSDTKVEALVSRIEYSEGKGYTLID